MDDSSPSTSLPDDVEELKRLLVARDQAIAEHQKTITQHEATITQHTAKIAALTQQRDAYYLEKLRLEVRLAKALKQAYGPRADRVGDLGQLLLDFGGQLDALSVRISESVMSKMRRPLLVQATNTHSPWTATRLACIPSHNSHSLCGAAGSEGIQGCSCGCGAETMGVCTCGQVESGQLTRARCVETVILRCDACRWNGQQRDELQEDGIAVEERAEESRWIVPQKHEGQQDDDY
jgi:hypothetical protein